MSETLTRTQANEGAPNWRYLLGRLHLTVRFVGFDGAVGFVNRVAAIAAEQDHHPEIDVRFDTVHLAVASHDVGGLTERDLRFCAAVDEVVGEVGAERLVAAMTETEIAIDALDIPAVLPFWRAVLAYEDHGDGALADPLLIGPTVWFQQMEDPRPQRNRIHLDVTVAHDEADARREAALAAGGRVVSDDAAPRFWVLSDAEGNEACICTWEGRDEFDAANADAANAGY